MGNKYSDIQYAIFGIKMKILSEQWKVETGKNNSEMFVELFNFSRTTVKNMYRGKVTDDNIHFFAEKLGVSVGELVDRNFKNEVEIWKYRWKDDTYKHPMIAAVLMVAFAVLFGIPQTQWIGVLMFVYADYFVHKAKNIWGFEIDYPAKRVFLQCTRLCAIIALIIFFSQCIRFSFMTRSH